MSKITIRTIGNRSLTESLAKSMDSETTHRTVSGAARRLKQINRDASDWSAATGQWGSVEIEVDGKAVNQSGVWGTIGEAKQDGGLVDLHRLGRELGI